MENKSKEVGSVKGQDSFWGLEKRTKTQVILLSQNTDAAIQQRSERFNLFF